MIVAAYFAASVYSGLKYSRRAGEDTGEFFLSGRNLPWWLAGTSMVATTFAADTPLAVTELVAKNGIAGNWIWWSFVLSGMLTVFFFARLWRRAGVLTDVEFVELRYSGRPAAFLRGFRSVYLGLFMNSVIIGWVNLAMAAILQGMFGLGPGEAMVYVAAAMLLTAGYSAVAGLWGVAVTYVFQFVFAMTGCVVLTFFVLSEPAVGGLGGLVEKLPDWSLRLRAGRRGRQPGRHQHRDLLAHRWQPGHRLCHSRGHCTHGDGGTHQGRQGDPRLDRRRAARSDARDGRVAAAARRSGVLITGVLQDGPASTGGILPGDVVNKIGGKPVANRAELLNIVAALPPGSATSIGVQRGGKALDLTVTVAQRPRREAAR